MKRLLSMKTILASFGLLALGAGCGQTCSAVAYFSGAQLTLHLPPAAEVSAPETVTACRQPDCAMATIPATEPGKLMIATVTFGRPDVRGTLEAGAGGVRVLRLEWQADHISAADPRNAYHVEVKDSSGKVT